MEGFIETATNYPASIFTVLLATSIGYWLISTVLGLGDFGLDSDLGVDSDAGLDIEADIGGDIDGFAIEGDAFDTSTGEPEAGPSVVSGLLAATGIGVAPLNIVVSVFSLAAWTLVMLMMSVFSSPGPFASTLFIVGGVVVGFVASGRVARILRPLFIAQTATKHEQLIGRIATIRTGRVDATFGQGEIDGPGNEDHIAQIRCFEKNDLSNGDRALVVAVDGDGVFTISADRNIITTVG